MVERSEYGELYRRTFGKSMSRRACREGWERWQKLWASETEGMILHPVNEPPPPARENDYKIVLACGPLSFCWRTAEDFFLMLPDQWSQSGLGEMAKSLDSDPRKAARTFIHNAFVDGYALDPQTSTAIASGIVWLLSTSEAQIPIRDFHLLGYDISFVPGPLGQPRMFNFRAILSLTFDPDALKQAREMPLPRWQPPPT